MKLLGLYHIALLPTSDEDAFVSHMADAPDPQLTRVTSSVTHQLLKRPDGLRRYAWQLNVESMTGAYDFDGNLEPLQDHIKDFGVVFGVDTYAEVARDRSVGG